MTRERLALWVSMAPSLPPPSPRDPPFLLSLSPDAKALPRVFLTRPSPALLPGCGLVLPQAFLLPHGISGQWAGRPVCKVKKWFLHLLTTSWPLLDPMGSVTSGLAQKGCVLQEREEPVTLCIPSASTP